MGVAIAEDSSECLDKKPRRLNRLQYSNLRRYFHGSAKTIDHQQRGHLADAGHLHADQSSSFRFAECGFDAVVGAILAGFFAALYWDAFDGLVAACGHPRCRIIPRLSLRESLRLLFGHALVDFDADHDAATAVPGTFCLGFRL